MSSLKLISVGEVKTEKARKDGKKSRQYYTAMFQELGNPFAPAVQRNFFQSHNSDGTECMWKGAKPEDVIPFVNKAVPGSIVSRQVPDYEIAQADGTSRTVNRYTTVVLGHETVESVFRAQGHALDAPAKAMEAAGATTMNLVGEKAMA
jgi:hypothetical protein